MITDSLSFVPTTNDDRDGNDEQIDIPSPPSISIGISALDQKLVPYVADAVATCSTRTSYRSSLGCGSSSVVRPVVRFRQEYSSPCGLWIIRSNDDSHDSNRYRDANDDDELTIRTLTLRDAPLVNERWEYRSATSLAMIEQMISSTPGPQSHVVGISSDNDDEWCADSITNGNVHSDSVSIPTSTATTASTASTGSCCCVGVEINGVLCAWILQYLDGPLGMLWCEEPFRRRGLAKAVVLEAVDRLRKVQQQQQQQQQQKEKGRQQRNRQGSTVGERKDWGGIDDGHSTTTTTSSSVLAYSYIVDGNSGSERLFRSMGWERVQSVNWIGFSSSPSLVTTAIE
mmetsp:Transcript_26629/g.31415  ORF Transcript_26629/g.31415 Transcript_26629/m.31415 type:complete len:343 (+) Transcript_26629:2-1030(+)